jgi:hypothetical protein
MEHILQDLRNIHQDMLRIQREYSEVCERLSRVMNQLQQQPSYVFGHRSYGVRGAVDPASIGLSYGSRYIVRDGIPTTADAPGRQSEYSAYGRI